MTNCPDVGWRCPYFAGGRDGALVCLWFACALQLGCRTGLDAFSFKGREDERARQMAKADDVHGPLERFLKATGWSKSDGKKVELVNPPEAVAAYQQAENLLKQKRRNEAEKAFIAVSKKYKKYPIREDALYMAGECQFLKERYATAQISYDKVIKEFPSTRRLDDISKRKFEIARLWLGFPDIITANEVQPVNFEDIRSTPTPQTQYRAPSGPTYSVPILPNLWDQRRPLFDTQGRALEALKSIWLNDPTGPLADDAVMLSASHYLRRGDYVEADHMYELMRKEFPKSPHLENAFVLGSHVKLMNYQGPAYDGTDLDQARQLKESTLKLFPNRKDRDRIAGELKQIDEAHAARVWHDAEFWRKKRNSKAVAIYCKQLIEKYPDSSYAERAREQLAKISPKDKQDADPDPYDESARPGRASTGSDSSPDEPGPLREPATPPKKVPNRVEAPGRASL